MNPGLEVLLEQISSLRGKVHGSLSGVKETFNVFSVLSVQDKELAHSNILAELLNPGGEHGMGDAFLKLFISRMGLRGGPRITSVSKEYSIGDIRDDTGGRIDILLTSGPAYRCNESGANVIIIENKIFAADQPQQLIRYNNFCPQAKILYLTPDGRAPKTGSGPEIAKMVTLGSYRNHVLPWLEDCLKHTSGRPILHQTLVQYLGIVRTMTGQSPMSAKIAKFILESEDRFKAFVELQHSRHEVMYTVALKLREQVARVANRLAYDNLEFPNSDLTEVRATFGFGREEMRKANLCIRFQFERAEHGHLSFGFSFLVPTEANRSLDRYLLDRFTSEYPQSNPRRGGAYWAAIADWKKRLNWGPEDYADIQFRELFENDLAEKAEQLLRIFNEAVSDDQKTRG